MDEKILIVDDEQQIRAILKHLLADEGYLVRTADNGYKAIQIVNEFRPDLVLMDQKMPGINGIDTTVKIKEQYPGQTIIILTAHGAVSFAVDAIKKGAYDYLEKPFDNDKLLILIRRALQHCKMSSELSRLRNSINDKYSFKNIIGQSRLMNQVIEQVKCVCETDATVLLLGESGVGKEVIANAIHYNSKRKDKPMIAINCGAIPTHLIESELFGHEKGAFTDAKEAKPGKFEQVNGGTLFLDEISELPLNDQVKLLRILEERKITRVGGKKVIPVDFRLISATNQDMEKRVKQGKFRLDLFYRLNIFSITIPPLRERKDDIPLLAEHFMYKYNRQLGLNVKTISQKAIECLSNFNWPGNIRDLENAIQSAGILSQGDSIREEHLPLRIRGYGSLGHSTEIKGSLDEKVKKFNSQVEKEIILDALRSCNYNRTKTAEYLKISRKTLFNKMRQYNI
ncbi:Formate hydrogenlyase transcriptional activator [hydrothermal vent metagenome]|uniref:Formate hydrogenlyase transcriptional activator n=1 Tax=hydrothermal vent metagenome TaxID=652676 RepID=A0A3B0ULU9_9ZZZZ